MATIKQIQFKRSNVAGKRPLPADIAEGELAINIKDSTLFTKNADGAIIDLGFAKGGTINGNVVQTGSYTQTGDYTTSGDINAKTITLSAGVVSNGDISSRNGVLRTRANSSSNAHLWFEGVEMGEANSFERGVLYARPNTATEGTISFRVKNGFDNNNSQALFNFRGNGDFDTPRDLIATRDLLGQRSRLSIESIAPTMNASRLYTRDRAWNQFGGNESYGWNDLVGWTPGENGALALNYVYKGRAMASGTIWHQLLDDRSGSEWALYTGSGPANKMFSVFSQGGLGQGKLTGSLMIGGSANDISSLGTNSIALGETNTGVRRTSTGNIDIISSGNMSMRFSATEAINRSYNRLHVQHSDANGTAINPPGNNAQLQIDTSGDDNNTGGNGLTLLGYYTMGGEYNHYFRGKGEAVFNMGRGVNISNSLSVGGSVVPGNYSNFDSRYQNLFNLGANVNLNNLTGGSQLGEYSQHSNVNTSLALNYPEAQAGHLTITGGAGVQQRYHVYNSSRVYLRAKYSTDAWKPWDRVLTEDYLNSGIPSSFVSKTADGFRIAYGSYGFFIRNDGGNTYFMLTNSGDNMGTWNGLRPITISNATGQVSIGTPLVVTHASGIDVSSTAGDAISWGNGAGTSIRGCLSNDGNLRGSTWSQFGGNQWASGALGWVNAQNVAKSGDTMTGVLNINANGPGLQLNTVSASQSVYLLGRRQGTNAFYVGIGGSGNNVTLHNYLFNTTINLNQNDITFSNQLNAPEFYLTSDIRYKKNITKLEDQRSNLHKVEIKRYEMKDGSNDHAVGVIAQEIEDIYPEFVTKNDEGMRHVNYRGLSTVLWKIVQEQDKELEDVKARLARIEELLSK